MKLGTERTEKTPSKLPLDKPKRLGYNTQQMDKSAQKLGKRGGKVKTDAKAKAARENGKKGGRPRKKKI